MGKHHPQPPAPNPLGNVPGDPAGPTTYPVSKLGGDTNANRDDKFYLWKMSYFYRIALMALPGAHELHFDVLTNDQGELYSDGVPQPPGTVKDENLRIAIATVFNYAGSTNVAMAIRFDAAAYTGALAPIYANLVAKKLAGN